MNLRIACRVTHICNDTYRIVIILLAYLFVLFCALTFQDIGKIELNIFIPLIFSSLGFIWWSTSIGKLVHFSRAAKNIALPNLSQSMVYTCGLHALFTIVFPIIFCIALGSPGLFTISVIFFGSTAALFLLVMPLYAVLLFGFLLTITCFFHETVFPTGFSSINNLVIFSVATLIMVITSGWYFTRLHHHQNSINFLQRPLIFIIGIENTISPIGFSDEEKRNDERIHSLEKTTYNSAESTVKIFLGGQFMPQKNWITFLQNTLLDVLCLCFIAFSIMSTNIASQFKMDGIDINVLMVVCGCIMLFVISWIPIFDRLCSVYEIHNHEFTDMVLLPNIKRGQSSSSIILKLTVGHVLKKQLISWTYICIMVFFIPQHNRYSFLLIPLILAISNLIALACSICFICEKIFIGTVISCVLLSFASLSTIHSLFGSSFEMRWPSTISWVVVMVLVIFFVYYSLQKLRFYKHPF
jgi:hypothetical protein